MTIKKIIMPLLVVTQVCYGADAAEAPKKETRAEAVRCILGNTERSLARIAALFEDRPDLYATFASKIHGAVTKFDTDLTAVKVALQRQCEEAADKPRTVVPQPTPLSKSIFPGLADGSDHEGEQ